jgi:hypothetical protein
LTIHWQGQPQANGFGVFFIQKLVKIGQTCVCQVYMCDSSLIKYWLFGLFVNSAKYFWSITVKSDTSSNCLFSLHSDSRSKLNKTQIFCFCRIFIFGTQYVLFYYKILLCSSVKNLKNWTEKVKTNYNNLKIDFCYIATISWIVQINK